ncbi:hypothetical protein ACFV0T_13345 [Streptomyces sp. NPDC059582]|uniref:hypothetical protein n=1 Tax=Streptomyces sp. NPDC059582 TaxID=3346875 RepID=UPI0036C56D89
MPMAHSDDEYTDFDGPRKRAAALRRAGPGRHQIRNRPHIDSIDSEASDDILNRGRLIIYVISGAASYRRTEGAWYGIVLGANSAT